MPASPAPLLPKDARADLHKRVADLATRDLSAALEEAALGTAAVKRIRALARNDVAAVMEQEMKAKDIRKAFMILAHGKNFLDLNEDSLRRLFTEIGVVAPNSKDLQDMISIVADPKTPDQVQVNQLLAMFFPSLDFSE